MLLNIWKVKMSLFKPKVEKMKAKKDVKGLINALKYKKVSDVRKSAAFALGDIGNAIVTP